MYAFIRQQYLLSPPCVSWQHGQLHIYAFLNVRQHSFSAYEKRSQILAPEDLDLMPIRFGSYGDKIWFFRPEDLAAFLLTSN